MLLLEDLFKAYPSLDKCGIRQTKTKKAIEYFEKEYFIEPPFLWQVAQTYYVSHNQIYDNIFSSLQAVQLEDIFYLIQQHCSSLYLFVRNIIEYPFIYCSPTNTCSQYQYALKVLETVHMIDMMVRAVLFSSKEIEDIIGEEKHAQKEDEATPKGPLPTINPVDINKMLKTPKKPQQKKDSIRDHTLTCISYQYMYTIYVSLITTAILCGRFSKVTLLLKQFKELSESESLNWEKWMEQNITNLLVKFRQCLNLKIQELNKDLSSPAKSIDNKAEKGIQFISLIFKLSALRKLSVSLDTTNKFIADKIKLDFYPSLSSKAKKHSDCMSESISVFKMPLFVVKFEKDFWALSNILREYAKHYFEYILSTSERKQAFDYINAFIANTQIEKSSLAELNVFLKKKEKREAFKACISLANELTWINHSILTTFQNFSDEPNQSSTNSSIYKEGIEIYKGRAFDKLYSFSVDVCQSDKMVIGLGTKGIREISIRNSLSHRPRADGGLKIMDEEGHSYSECLKRYINPNINKNSAFVSIQASLEYLFPDIDSSVIIVIRRKLN